MAPDKVDLAYVRLVRDHSLQLRFTPYTPPVFPPWLAHFLKMVGAALPHFAVVFWVVLAVAVVALIVYLAGDRARAGRPRRNAPPLQLGDEPWAPSAPAARALLAEADDLAARGAFAEAAHILLIRSVEDIRARRPLLLAPSLTSRDIAGLGSLPDGARAAFRPIVALVEQSLFGGRPVDREAFATCRDAYERFALPATWAGAAPN